MLNAYNSEHGTNYTLDSDARLKNSLLLEAEQKKKILTAKPQVRGNVTFNGVSTKIEISRELFDQLTEGKLNETIDKTLELLEIAKDKGVERVDEVLLVGGSSRMPQIKARLDAELGVNARLDDPDECVAKGAAIFAINEAFAAAMGEYENDDTGDVEKPKPISNSTRTRIVNVTSKTYGTDMGDSNGNLWVKNLIFANAALPTKAIESFTTAQDGQSGVSMKVYESDVTDPEQDEIIQERFAVQLEDKVLPLSKWYPKGTPIDVVFEIDNEGILSVHAEVDEIDAIDFNLTIKGVRDEQQLALAQAQINKMNIE
jgi:molecular chaperone DnaK (HSP70)